MNKINKQRKDYITWDEYFMSIAKLTAMRSKEGWRKSTRKI